MEKKTSINKEKLELIEKKECPHQKIVLVYTTGKELQKGGYEKDLLVRCHNCNQELFRTSVYNKDVVNLLPF